MFKQFLYRAYSKSAVGQPLGRRFTKVGFLLVIVLVISAVLGLDTRRTVVYRAFAFLFVLLVISYLWSLFFRLRITATRILPKFGTAGEPFEYQIILKNFSPTVQKGLHLFENTDPPIPTLEEFLSTPEPSEECRNAYDRTLLVYRWNWLVSQKRAKVIRAQPLPTLLPDSDTNIQATLTPARRGYLHLTGLTIARPDPVNLFNALIQIPVRQSVLILPKRYDLPPIQLPGTRKFKRGGVALASSVGESEEFVSLRDYRPGDPLRRIHWRSWAKTGKPIVKEYQDEYFVRHALVLDTFQSTAYSEIFEEAISVAASFACTVRTQDSLLDLMFVGTEAYCFTAGRGLAHTEQMLEILASVSTCQDKPFSTLPPIVIEHAQLLSGCICILLAWDAERRNFIDHLHTLGIPMLVFVVTDEKTKQSVDQGSLEERPDHVYVLEVGKVQEGLANYTDFS
jgi:uncharacterized protein (DUF58 family)